MKITLKPHHLLCLQGYRGRNYNQLQKDTWFHVSELLKVMPDAEILVTNGKDDLCAGCPAVVRPKDAKCKEDYISEIDNKVGKFLDLKEGETYKYKDLFTKMYEVFNPEKHREICSKCTWWKFGLCQDTFYKK